MLHSLVSQIALGALIATCSFAAIKGSAAERWGAFLVLVSWLGGDGFSFLFHRWFAPRFLELTLLTMDAGLAIGFLLLAMRFAKIWLGVGMLLQSGELGLHGAIMADWGLPYPQYLLLNNLLSFALLAVLMSATILEWVGKSRAQSGERRVEPGVLA
jgi:hypothetical protein